MRHSPPKKKKKFQKFMYILHIDSLKLLKTLFKIAKLHIYFIDAPSRLFILVPPKENFFGSAPYPTQPELCTRVSNLGLQCGSG